MKNMKKDDVSKLTKLGDHNTKYEYYEPNPNLLETFPNKYPNRDYITEFVFKEFTSLCPKTGQPDFATISVRYIPKEKCIETKSLKLYFLSFRQHGSFMETITNMILEDLVAVCSPKWMKITANFNARGGTLINVEAEYHENERR
jgi:7-cyano-7-deazaguanine reductase